MPSGLETSLLVPPPIVAPPAAPEGMELFSPPPIVAKGADTEFPRPPPIVGAEMPLAAKSVQELENPPPIVE